MNDPQAQGRIISELMRLQSGRDGVYACRPARDWLVEHGYAQPCGSDATLTPLGKAMAEQILAAWDGKVEPQQQELFG